ncbi:RidA family protein [Candidatus Palauibacter sp.]|uniref:RidA family protein n=1 Tax=Candidatus Palauibacter sp. TaxID=3101350 RepID=UPI003AF27819
MTSRLPPRCRAGAGRSAASPLAGVFALLLGASGVAGQTPEERLAELGIELPAPDAPTANFVKAVTTGNLVFLAGHGPCGGLDETNTGKVGLDHTVEEGYAIARRVGVCLLASLAREIGDLSRVKRIVRVFGMVNTPPDFTQHSQVINGCSDLMERVFGPAISKHARAAVGMASLPRDQSVEIEMLVELHDP